MEDAYERVTLAVEEAHWWYRGRRRVLRVALDSLDLPRDVRLLDAGSGSGRNMIELRDFGAVSGLEPSPRSAAAAEARAVGPVAVAPIEAMPFPDASFDAATSLDVIEHIDDDRAALGELRRVVRPGGFLILTVPAYQWLWSDHDERNQHRRRYSRGTLVSAARDAGWSPVWTSYFNSLLLPAAVVARLVERVRPPAPGRPSEFERTGGVLNPLLEQPFRLEAALLRAGVRLPAGLSLIGVFRRDGGR